MRRGEGSEQAGPFGRRRRPKSAKRRRNRLFRVVVPNHRGVRPLEEPESGLDEQVGVVQLFGERSCFAKGISIVCVACLALSRPKRSEEPGTLLFIWSGPLGDEFECLLVPADCVIGRERVAGGITGASYVVKGLVRVGGPRGGNPMMR